MSATESLPGLNGGRVGDLRLLGVGERGACGLEVRRKEVDRILDWREREGGFSEEG